MYRSRPNLQIGFHGCDEAVREQLVTKPDVVKESQESYDWLGHGFYVWENNYQRAFQWALDKQNRDTLITPSVIGVVYQLDYCLDFTDSNDCFQGVDIAGGVCYFLWDDLHLGLCSVVNINNGKASRQDRKLSQHKTFIRDSNALSIIDKVNSCESQFLNSRVSSRKPFGLTTNIRPISAGDIVLRYNGGKGPFNRSDVLSGINWIDKWKVITSYLTYDHAGRADKDGKKRIISTLEILAPNEICTETYIIIDSLDTEYEAFNLLNYIKTKFSRFLISQLTSTQHITKGNYALVPIQDFTNTSDIDWSQPVADIDRQLYAKYGLSKEVIGFIEEMIKVMG